MSDTGTAFHEVATAEAIRAYEAWKAKLPKGGPEPPPLSEYQAAVVRNEAAAQNWSNPAFRRAKLTEQAAAAEAERRSRPHPRLVLREAHERRAEAQALVEQAQTAVDKAAEFLRLGEERLAGIEKSLGERRAGVVARLTDQFRGLAAPPREGGGFARGADNNPERLGPLKAAQIQAQTDVETAKAAHDKLAAELIAVQTTLQRIEDEVFGAVVAVLVRAAEDRAEEICAAEKALAAQRVSLDALARGLAEKERAAGRAVLTQFPPAVWAALNDPEGRPRLRAAQMGEVAPWRAVIDALAADPEAHSALAPLPPPAASE